MNSQSQNFPPDISLYPANKGNNASERLSGNSALPRPHIRSCLFCRSRKVKCDRQRSCANCLRAGSECVYPSGPGRAPKRPRRALDERVTDRLAHLEMLVRRLDTEGGQVPAVASEIPTTSTAIESEDGSSQVEQQLGRLVIDETRSCYVSNVLWARLGDEIEGLRDLLHESASEDEDLVAATDLSVDETTTSLGSNAAIMGFQALAQSLRTYHPPLSQSVALFEIFKMNVAPLALLFAIYYSTVISMESEQCEDVLGFPRATAVKHYQFAMQQAVARADLLNTQSVILIQAVVLFLSALRNEDASRTAWSMTVLIFHIARAMGLHRDGAAFGLRPAVLSLCTMDMSI
ncbi:Zn(II)2Cys6 transcription factor [Penicillium lividum]|nr:Zn(II)2Cys6 transcription factor [Penicillium lividum]